MKLNLPNAEDYQRLMNRFPIRDDETNEEWTTRVTDIFLAEQIIDQEGYR